MRISIMVLALALGTSTGWAQQVTEPPQDEADTVVTDAGEWQWRDNRSTTGEWNGGHRGSVSTMARAGLGPVFGSLRSQGYRNIEISQADGQLFVSAERFGEARSLVYNASNGSLLSDESVATSDNPIQRMFGRVRDTIDDRGRAVSEAAAAGAAGIGKDRGRGSQMRSAARDASGPGAGRGKAGNNRGGSKASSKGGGSKGGSKGGGGRGSGKGGGKGKSR